MHFRRRDIIKLSLLTMSYIVFKVPVVNGKIKNIGVIFRWI